MLIDHVRTHYHCPPAFPPLEEGWRRIEAARAGRGAIVHRRGRMVAWLSAAVLLIAAGITVWSVAAPRELAASQSELRFSESHPTPGAVVQVEYRPIPTLAGERHLVLRARLRTPKSDWENWMQPHVTLARLQRDGSVFRGSFTLPPSTAYAVFAVEDTLAQHVDAHGEQWEMLVHDGARKPQLDALMQQYRDLDRRDSRASLATARALRARFPQSPVAIHTWYWAERARLSNVDTLPLRDSLRAALSAIPPASRLGPADLYALAQLYEVVGREPESRGLRARLHQSHPRSAEAVDLLIDSVVAVHGGDVVAMRGALDALWGRVDTTAAEGLARTGLRLADNAKDPASITRWARRLTPLVVPLERLVIGGAVGKYHDASPALRSEILAMTHHSIQLLRQSRDQRRMLNETAAARLHSDQSLEGHYLGLVGRLAHAEGDTAQAMALLTEAMRLRWNAGVFQTMGDLRLAQRDTAGAARAYAWAAADPEASAARADSVRRRVGRYGADSTWNAYVEEGRRRLAADFLPRARRTELPGQLLLVDAQGREAPLALRGNPAPVVVALWSPNCPRAVAELRQLEAVARRIEPVGGRVILVSGDGPMDGKPDLGPETRIREVYYDTRGAFRRAVHEWGSPTYFVVDPHGLLRYKNWGLADVTRQVTALRSELH